MTRDANSALQLRKMLCSSASKTLEEEKKKYLIWRQKLVSKETISISRFGTRAFKIHKPAVCEEEEEEVVDLNEEEEGDEADADVFSIVDSEIFVHYINTSDSFRPTNPERFSFEMLLSETNPEHIVLMDLDVAFMRCIEIFQKKREARDTGSHLKVYIMMPTGSSEESLYLMQLREESGAFSKLGKMHITGSVPKVKSDFLEKKPIFVDLREFKSALPCVLYSQEDLEIIPLVLSVGDYILSSRVCVERKSIPDLIGSFSSGRLYDQVKAMFRNFDRPLLLIEMGDNGPFYVQLTEWKSMDISFNDLSSKLVMLLLHFPHLRILWSLDNIHTVKYFRDLQRETEIEELEKLKIELSRSDAVEVTEDLFYTVEDIVGCIPGVSSRNIRTGFSSLRHMLTLKESDIESRIPGILGTSLAGFIHRKLF